MVLVRDVLADVERLAPPSMAFGFDRIGLLIGDPASAVTGVMVTLDVSLGCIAEAQAKGCNVIVAHHPLIWDPVKRLVAGSSVEDRVMACIRAGISVIAAHTNWDCAPGGINDVLASLLGLQEVAAFGSSNPQSRLKLTVFVPSEARAALVDALSGAGAGVVGHYERCAFWGSGVGTFRPGTGASPVIGSVGSVEEVAEDRVEMMLDESAAPAVLAALRAAHPYEEPAFDLVAVRGDIGQPAGRIGVLPSPLSAAELLALLNHRLETRTEMWVPRGGGPISRVAVTGGAASDEWAAARAAGADAFVTGEVPHHLGMVASDAGMVIAASGHFATEHPGMMRMADLLSLGVPVHRYEPQPGVEGRPLI